jgi:predicted DNA-binding protein (MmcQ/YjbR family)
MKVAALDTLCGGWPGVTQDVKWGNDHVFSVGGKMFCVTAVDAAHKGGGISFKVDPERLLELTDQPGIIPAPYMAKHGWVLVQDPKALPARELSALIRRSYELVAAKLSRKARRELGIE